MTSTPAEMQATKFHTNRAAYLILRFPDFPGSNTYPVRASQVFWRFQHDQLEVLSLRGITHLRRAAIAISDTLRDWYSGTVSLPSRISRQLVASGMA
jgi:hypothetical protein